MLHSIKKILKHWIFYIKNPLPTGVNTKEKQTQVNKKFLKKWFLYKNNCWPMCQRCRLAFFGLIQS